MSANSPVRNKSFAFAVRIVNLNKYLCSNKQEYVLSKQLLRSGTAIGALVTEAEQAESKADFIHKISDRSQRSQRNRILDIATARNQLSHPKRKRIYIKRLKRTPKITNHHN